MSGALRRKSLVPSWRTAAETHGLDILCIHGTDGERFTLAPLDDDRLSERAARGLMVGTSLTEAELRAQLTQAGFSDMDSESGIQLSRAWAFEQTHSASVSGPLRRASPSRASAAGAAPTPRAQPLESDTAARSRIRRL
jgi:hypothetical protein